jgi:beta-1,2-mannobiose phosphorylase / 1,2-beta-oligomannan phosphorylase
MDRADYLHQIVPTRGGWQKHPASPVLGGPLGTCFDLSMLVEDGLYRMWFSWRPRKSIALCESQDGVHWSAPRIVLGPRQTPRGWEEDLNRPAVIQQGGRYHLWYTGQFPGILPRGADGHSWIFHATSPDGVVWDRSGAEPVLSPDQPWEKAAVMNPSVLWDERAGLFRLWYAAGEQYEPNAIGHAASPDGITWTKISSNPVFGADPANPWEQHKVAGCHVVYQDGWYLLFYIGYWDEDTAQIGIARSRDGLTGWQRHPENPVIAPGLDAWDGEACYKPFAICDGRRWRLWYNGRRGNMEQIGLAEHEGEDLGFE